MASGTQAAEAYDAWFTTGLGCATLAIETAVIEDLARPRHGEQVLDAGCGTGVFTSWLVDLGAEATGLDRDPAMLSVARRKSPQATFVEGDVTRLPFPDRSFDLVVMVTVLCFLSDSERERTARELLRVARGGGRVVVLELARLSPWAALRRVKGWLGSSTWAAARFTTASELHRLFLDAGAAQTTVRHGLYVPPVGRPLLVSRAAAFERAGQRLGPLGAGIVAVRADVR